MKQASQDSDSWEKGNKQGKSYNYINLLPEVNLQAIEQKERTQKEPSNLDELKGQKSNQSSESPGLLEFVANETEKRKPEICRGIAPSLCLNCVWIKETTWNQGKNHFKGAGRTFLGAHTEWNIEFNPKNDIAIVMGLNWP